MELWSHMHAMDTCIPSLVLKTSCRQGLVFIMKSMAVEILHRVVGWVEDDFQNYRVVWFSLHIDAKIHHVYVDPEKISPGKTAHMRQYKSHSMTV